MAYKIGGSCTGCDACTRFCPVFAISGEKWKRHEINTLRCVSCGVCGRICSNGAISDSGGTTCTPLRRSLWPEPHVDVNVCSACGICVQDCTSRALSISPPKQRGDIRVYAELSDPGKCTGCGICEKHCPLEAIIMVSHSKELPQ